MSEESWDVVCPKCGAIADCRNDHTGWFNGYSVNCPRCGKGFHVARPERVY